MMETIRLWSVAATFAIGLLALSAYLDGPSDIEADAATQAAKADAIAQAQAERQTEAWRVANRVCRSLHAERAKLMRLESGEYVCRRTVENT